MSIDTSNGHPEMDYDEHRRTYEGFISFSKYITLGIVVLLILMALFLV